MFRVDRQLAHRREPPGEPPLIFQYISAPNNVCGNGIVESWEECDCGETKRDCQDKCCYAADHRDLPCQLRERKTCR